MTHLMATTAGAVMRRSALSDAVPQVVGSILQVFLTLAAGLVIAAYADAAARRVRPRIVLTQERRSDDLNNAVIPFFLLALLVGVSMLMGVKF